MKRLLEKNGMGRASDIRRQAARRLCALRASQITGGLAPKMWAAIDGRTIAAGALRQWGRP